MRSRGLARRRCGDSEGRRAERADRRSDPQAGDQSADLLQLAGEVRRGECLGVEAAERPLRPRTRSSNACTRIWLWSKR